MQSRSWLRCRALGNKQTTSGGACCLRAATSRHGAGIMPPFAARRRRCLVRHRGGDGFACAALKLRCHLRAANNQLPARSACGVTTQHLAAAANLG